MRGGNCAAVESQGEAASIATIFRRCHRGAVRDAIARSGIDPAAEPVADEGARRAVARMLRQRLAGALAALSATDRDALLL
jgi:hypothetical protein